MLIDQKIYETFSRQAAEIRVRELTIGLGYTSVVLEDGSTGLAYTWLDAKTGCSVIKDPEVYEGAAADRLLEKIRSGEPLERTLAVATANALNHRRAAELRDDKGSLLDELRISAGKRVAMVGFFGPVIEEIKGRKAETVIYDIGKDVGDRMSFFNFLEEEADALILTSTSLLNGSTEEVLGHIRSRDIPAVLLGPTTIMEPGIYRDLPVTMLAGTVPVDSEKVVQSVRNGKGTPVIQKFSRKVYTVI